MPESRRAKMSFHDQQTTIIPLTWTLLATASLKGPHILSKLLTGPLLAQLLFPHSLAHPLSTKAHQSRALRSPVSANVPVVAHHKHHPIEMMDLLVHIIACYPPESAVKQTPAIKRMKTQISLHHPNGGEWTIPSNPSRSTRNGETIVQRWRIF